jgi:hypothetical protein
MKKLIGVIAVVGAVTILLSEHALAQRSYYYWYHPVGRSCPTWQYDPGVAHSPNRAQSACESATGGSCYQAQGSAAPAC